MNNSKVLQALAAGVVVAAVTLGCATLKVNTDYPPGTDFSKYKSFSIKKGTPPKNPIAADRLENALGNALQARGFTRVPDGGDLYVFSHFRLGKDTIVNSSGYGYGGYGGWAGHGGWGYGGGMQSSTTTVTEIPTGTLVVDLVDSKTNTAVWRGYAKDNISTTATPDEREQKANVVFQTLFANFPPTKK